MTTTAPPAVNGHQDVPDTTPGAIFVRAQAGEAVTFGGRPFTARRLNVYGAQQMQRYIQTRLPAALAAEDMGTIGATLVEGAFAAGAFDVLVDLLAFALEPAPTLDDLMHADTDPAQVEAILTACFAQSGLKHMGELVKNYAAAVSAERMTMLREQARAAARRGLSMTVPAPPVNAPTGPASRPSSST